MDLQRTSGHGAGYGVYEKLKEGLGTDVNYVFDTEPISIWLADQKSMDAKLPPVIKMVGEEFEKVKPGVAIRSAHVGMAASNTYVFLMEVLPRAIKKYGATRCAGRRWKSTCPKAARCSALASSSTAEARQWRAKTNARFR
jgi:hypothetical protein